MYDEEDEYKPSVVKQWLNHHFPNDNRITMLEAIVERQTERLNELDKFVDRIRHGEDVSSHCDEFTKPCATKVCQHGRMYMFDKSKLVKKSDTDTTRFWAG